MFKIPKFKVNFEYEKRQKDKRVKLPRAHVYQLSRIRKVVLVLLICLIGYFAYVLVLANAVAHKNTQLRHNITTLTKKLDKASAGTTSYNPLVGQYLADFLTAYYNFDKDKSSDWVQNVTPYFAKNIKISADQNTVSTKLDKAKLNGIFTVDGVKTAQYEVTIDNNGHQSAMTVNVPYTQANTQLTVIGLPYVTNPVDTVGQVGEARFTHVGKPINDDKVLKKVRTFTKQFIQRYVSSSTKDMSLIMDNPVGLDNAVELVNFNENDVTVTGSITKPVVKTTITVKVKGAEVTQAQTVYLELKKQGDTYFVKKFLQA
ncbi:conjugal transfer protein [Weissella confusa]|uniref:conjugal transfer protein n=1 Tax=Weissella confusa TaxID=1583 RepID=UPI001C6FABFC|nr:conjugal transfer protein [Weissella confusa]QYU58816.1 conjugal transfer protein [Weissella confusa]